MLAIRLCPRQSSRRIRRIDCQSLRDIITGPENVGHLVLSGGARSTVGVRSPSLSSSLPLARTVTLSPTLNHTTAGRTSSHQNCIGATRHLAVKQTTKRTPGAGGAQQSKKKENQVSGKQSKTLVNEKLVTAIMQNNNNAISAADVKVRVTADPLVQLEEGQPKKEAQVMTLQDAIQTAVVEQKDLVGISVQQEVPVLTISTWESLQYKADKLTRERRRNNATQAASVLKETTVKVGISDHDLTRKVNGIIVFLSKGHNCQIVVKAPRRYAIKDPAGARNMADRVVDMVEDNGGELVREVVMNDEQTQAKFFVRPRKL